MGCSLFSCLISNTQALQYIVIHVTWSYNNSCYESYTIDEVGVSSFDGIGVMDIHINIS